MLLIRAFPGAGMVKDNCGRTPLHCAAENQLSADSLALLIQSNPGAVVELDHCRRTPLHEAARNAASAHVIALLVQAYPAAVTELDDLGHTPLLVAATAFWALPAASMRLLLQTSHRIAGGASTTCNDKTRVALCLAMCNDEHPCDAEWWASVAVLVRHASRIGQVVPAAWGGLWLYSSALQLPTAEFVRGRGVAEGGCSNRAILSTLRRSQHNSDSQW